MSGNLVHSKLESGDNRFRKALAAGKSDHEIVDELYLAALSRLPSTEERESARRHIAKSDNRAAALADVCWAILNTNEFVFQH